jgi:hypothetical protein
MFVFYFVRFQWIFILDVFGWLYFEIRSNISSNPFLKLVLHMSWIVIFCRTLNSSMDHKHDKVMYMLYMLKHMLSGGCWRSIIKLSNVCYTVQWWNWSGKGFNSFNLAEVNRIKERSLARRLWSQRRLVHWNCHALQ